MDDDFKDAVDIIPGRYAVCFLKHPDAARYSAIAASGISYSIDDELLYEPFYADFGPLNLGKTFRFCEHTKQLLQEAEKRGKKLYLYAGPQPQAKANAAVLVGVFQVLYLNTSPDDAYAPLAPKGPFMPFRDASCGVPTFNLQPLDCIRGIAKAREVGFLDSHGGSWCFNLAEYEHYEQVENGDLNWILPGKLLAFSGPAARPTDYVGFRAMVPEDYWEYFKRRGIQAVVRLNKKVYEAKRFMAGGFQHHELYFPDGSCPSQEILLRFLDIAEQTPGALAIHCKAGLGRTGVLICSYLMKHYRFTAEEVIGYIRVCRPGSVIGPQQGFIKDIQHIMWLEGDAYRAKHGPNPPPLMWGITPAAASIAAATAAAATSKTSSACSSSSCSTLWAPATSSVSIRGLVDALGSSRGASGESPTSPLAGPATPSLDKSTSDLSAAQMRDRVAPSSSPAACLGRSSSSNSGSNSNSSRAARSGVIPQQLFTGTNASGGISSGPAPAAAAAAGPLTSGLISRPSTTQSLLTRYTPAGSLTTAAAAAAPNMGSPAGSLSAHHSSTNATSYPKDRPHSSNINSSNKGVSTREAAIGALLNSSIASLRASLHTEKPTAINRPKVQPQGVISQSSDFTEASWRSPTGLAGSISSNSGTRPGSSVARVLAPNGQPRKVPVAALTSAMMPPAAVTTGAGASAGLGKGMLQTPHTPQQQPAGAGGVVSRLTAYYNGN